MIEPLALEACISLLKSNRISNNEENSFFVMKFMNGLLQQDQVLAFIVAMHARNVLENFLNELIRRLKLGDGQKNWIQIGTRLLGTIVVIGSECFLKHFKEYQKIVQAAQGNKRVFQWIEQNTVKYAIRQPIEENSKQQVPEMSQWEVIRDLLNQIWRIEKIHENFELRKEINAFIIDHLLPANAHTCLEQIALTWIKEYTEKIQAEKAENLCCKIHFKHNSKSQTEKFGQSNNQEFKDYRWPLENESIVNHLAKTVVSFLNTAGGIVFVGMKEDKEKMIQATGIKFKAEERINFLFFMHDNIMKRIFPKTLEEERRVQTTKDEKEEINQARKELKEMFQRRDYEYRISKYVYVDFMEVYEGTTLLYSKEDSSDLCIARIKVKTGDPCELYHIINDNNIPEAYFREDKSVKKKSMVEFYDQFYKRMKNTKETEVKGETHENCRFNPKTYDPPRFR